MKLYSDYMLNANYTYYVYANDTNIFGHNTFEKYVLSNTLNMTKIYTIKDGHDIWY